MNVWNRNMSSMEKLSEALDLDMISCRRIGLVGGGGKTTALFRLAREALEAGLRVIITTTTHMKMERGIPLLVDAQTEAVAEALTQSPIVMTGCRDPKNPEKISGVSEEMLQAYEKLANLVLVEADGAKRLPLKAPAGWEPVLPGQFDVVIGVAGVDAVGKPFADTCFRPELAAGLLGKNVSDVVVPADLAELLCHAGGAKKSVTGSYRILLNKADGEKAIACAREVLARIAGREKAAVASLKEKMVVVLLAAGNSTRFHGNKLLYPVDGIPMYLHTLEMVRKLPVEILAVTQYEEIQQEMESYGIHVIWNDAPEEGISHSIHLGIRNSDDADAWMFVVCDQPYLRAETLEALLNCWALSPSRLAAVRCGDREGNPNVFGRRYREELLALSGDRGGRGILKRHAGQVSWLEVSDERELTDLDTREQEKAMREKRETESKKEVENTGKWPGKKF